jgi:hypothetical protein
MSRPVTTRFRICGTLIAETPIHVGGIDGNPATDLPLMGTTVTLLPAPPAGVGSPKCE